MSMEIVVVAKTKWGEFFCIGGIEISTKKFIRLMDLNGGYQPANTSFKVGQVWEVDYESIPGRPPHLEDVKILSKSFVNNINLLTFIKENCIIWDGGPIGLYDSKLKWKNGSGFLNDPKDVPQNSVGFWLSDKDLILQGDYYIYKMFLSDKKFKYKGEFDPIPIIPSGTLLRVSLAKWWSPKNDPVEERCYLQLSGWYI